jgi:hypothetical protein
MTQTNFFNSDGIEDGLYESVLDLNPSYSESMYAKLYVDFKLIMGDNIDNIVRIQQKYINENYIQSVKKSNLEKILNKIYLVTHNLISDNSNRVTIQLFLTHILTSFFRKYCIDNELDKDIYNTTIYIPSVLSALTYFLADAKVTINRLINQCLTEIVDNSKKIIEFYTLLYNVDEDIIKSDIVHYFIEYVLPDTDPISLNDLNQHYLVTIRQLIYYYLKTRTIDLAEGNVNLNFPLNGIFDLNNTRFNIYETGIHFYKLSQICETSRAYNNILSNYKTVTGILLSNDLQEIILSISNSTSLSKHKNKQMLSSYVMASTSKELKLNWPLIYKLLRSIRVRTNINIFSKEQLLKIKYMIRDNLYTQIISNTSVDKDKLLPIVESISNRFSQSFKNCKFIDPVDLDVVYFNKDHLILQLNKFINHIITEIIINES